jgi:hypothetical protein
VSSRFRIHSAGGFGPQRSVKLLCAGSVARKPVRESRKGGELEVGAVQRQIWEILLTNSGISSISNQDPIRWTREPGLGPRRQSTFCTIATECFHTVFVFNETRHPGGEVS